MGFTHVYFKKDQVFHCAIGSNCIRFEVTVSKKTVTKSLCPHEHIASVLSGKHKLPAETPSKLLTVPKPTPKFSDSDRMAKTSEFVYKNRKLDLSKNNKKNIERQIMKLNLKGWPKSYEPSELECPCCSARLGPPVKHQGKLN